MAQLVRIVPVLFTVLCILLPVSESKKPHIIFIAADDLGWNDVGWRNPDIHTPNLDSLVKNGVLLNNSYVMHICSPSRSAFMTGYYPYKIGTQNMVILSMAPVGLPAKFDTLPSSLKTQGYSTHLVGKWHLGFCHWNYTPTYRGFDSFLGYYSGAEDYYTHRVGNSFAKGLDFRYNKEVLRNYNNTYSTYIFADRVKAILEKSSPNDPLFLYMAFQSVHSPLEVPKKYEDMYKNIKDKSRRVFSGMVTAMDDAVGQIIGYLKQYGFYDDAIIAFTNDNGGQTYSGGNNWPLRGNKFTLWEGGTRSNAFVHSKLLKTPGRVYSSLFHAVDWYPTFLYMAGLNKTSVDGVNQWPSIRDGTPGPRTEFVYNIYGNDAHNPAAIRMGKYKYIRGYAGYPSGWYPVPNSGINATESQESLDANPPFVRYLFDIEADPIEKVNLAHTNPDLVKMMDDRITLLSKASVKPLSTKSDSKGNPKYWNDTWSPGWCSYA